MEDAARLKAFRDGIRKALDEQAGAHVMTVSSTSCLTPLLAALEGAGHVSAFSKSRSMYRWVGRGPDALTSCDTALGGRARRVAMCHIDAGSSRSIATLSGNPSLPVQRMTTVAWFGGTCH